MHLQKTKLIVLWLLVLIGMILHFNYHIGEIFYGIDVVRPGADGTVPSSVLVIRTLFYHLPMIWILLILYFNKKGLNLVLFILSILYLFAHLGHLFGELKKEVKDPSQISLLALVFVIAVLLSTEHYKYWRKNEES